MTTSNYFRGTRRAINPGGREMEVQIDGIRHANGRTERLIVVADRGSDAIGELTSEQARELGRALLAAANEVDQTN